MRVLCAASYDATLVGAWLFDEGMGEVITDATDGGNAGETYTIKAMPGWRTTGVSASSYTVVVAANDTITSVTCPSGAVNPTEGSYSLSLSTPNVSGSVVKADGSTAAIDAHIDIQKWYDGSGPADGAFTDPEDYTQWED